MNNDDRTHTHTHMMMIEEIIAVKKKIFIELLLCISSDDHNHQYKPVNVSKCSWLCVSVDWLTIVLIYLFLTTIQK